MFFINLKLIPYFRKKTVFVCVAYPMPVCLMTLFKDAMVSSELFIERF